MQNYCKYSIKSHDRCHNIEEGGRNGSATFGIIDSKNQYQSIVAMHFNSMAIAVGRASIPTVVRQGWLSEIFGIYLVVGMEVALHIYEKHGDVHQFIPTAATFFEYHTHVIEYASALSGEVELFEIAVFIGYQAGNFVGTGFAGANAGKE